MDLYFLECFRKNKDFDPILSEYSMLLNSKIEKEHFFPIYSGNINKFYQDKKLLSIHMYSK